MELKLTERQFNIDYEKVKTVEDIVAILKAMDIKANWYQQECPGQFKEIYEKGFLKECEGLNFPDNEE